MDTPSNVLKLFGMSNQLLLHELDEIENTYDLILGHKQDVPNEETETYYPQFEAQIRARAQEMAHHYETFYCLEVSIRTLISEVLKEKAGAAWWDNDQIVPKVVQDGVSSRIEKELDSGISRRSDESIDYTNFGELGEIIKKTGLLLGQFSIVPKVSKGY